MRSVCKQQLDYRDISVENALKLENHRAQSLRLNSHFKKNGKTTVLHFHGSFCPTDFIMKINETCCFNNYFNKHNKIKPLLYIQIQLNCLTKNYSLI